MTTVLLYLVIAAVIGLVVFFLAVFVFGRGEQMAPLDPRTSPAELPDHDITAEDVRKIRFALAVRGYRMSDVDWTLERLGDQLDELRRENAGLRGRLAPSDQWDRPDDQVLGDAVVSPAPSMLAKVGGPAQAAAQTTGGPTAVIDHGGPVRPTGPASESDIGDGPGETR